MKFWWGRARSGSRRRSGRRRNRNETDYSVEAWKNHLDEILTEEQKKRFPDISLLDIKGVSRDPERPFDTTVYLCIDRRGGLATAVSTSGWAWKYPGRLGDSPIIGAGSYADSRYGACACTGLGEMAIRAGTARTVVTYLKLGYGLRDAVREAARDLTELKTGFLDEVTIHAITPGGRIPRSGCQPAPGGEISDVERRHAVRGNTRSGSIQTITDSAARRANAAAWLCRKAGLNRMGGKN